MMMTTVALQTLCGVKLPLEGNSSNEYFCTCSSVFGLYAHLMPIFHNIACRTVAKLVDLHFLSFNYYYYSSTRELKTRQNWVDIIDSDDDLVEYPHSFFVQLESLPPKLATSSINLHPIYPPAVIVATTTTTNIIISFLSMWFMVEFPQTCNGLDFLRDITPVSMLIS